MCDVMTLHHKCSIYEKDAFFIDFWPQRLSAKLNPQDVVWTEYHSNGFQAQYPTGVFDN
jgi:hypothetical protein